MSAIHLIPLEEPDYSGWVQHFKEQHPSGKSTQWEKRSWVVSDDETLSPPDSPKSGYADDEYSSSED